MKKAIITLFLITIFQNGFSQEISIDELLNNVLNNYSQIIEKNKLIKIYGKGIYKNDNHLWSRDELNIFDINYEFDYSNSNTIYTYHSINQKNEKEYHGQIQYIEDLEYVFKSSKSLYFKTHPNNNIGNVLRTYYLSPFLLAQYIDRNKNRLTMSLKNGKNYQVNIQFPNSENWVLTISHDYLCQSFSYSSFDYLYGDVEEVVIWEDYNNSGFGYFPEKVVVNKKGYEEYNITQQVKEIESFEGINTDTVKIGKEKKKKDRVISSDSISIKKINEGLFEVELKETNNRLMIAEFDGFLILLEGSYHSKNGDLITSVIQKRFPEKPIKYVSFSHCHTQYIGMSRSHIANGSIIITTKDNFEFIEKLSTASFSQRPDKQELLGKQPVFEEIIESWNFTDSTNSIEIYNIKSNHTDQYLVFYFPLQKSIFVGDLLWVSNSKPKPLSGRSLLFYEEVIERLNLDIEMFYTSWPLDYYGVKSVITKNEIITK